MADRKITLNKTFTVDLAGDSIWSNENPASVEVTGITLRESDYGCLLYTSPSPRDS